MKTRIAACAVGLVLLLFSVSCAKPQPDAAQTAGAALKKIHAAQTVTLTDGDRKLTAQKASDRWNVTVYSNETVELAVTDGLYIFGANGPERVAPVTIPLLSDARIDEWAASADVSADGRQVKVSLDLSARTDAAVEAVARCRDERLSALGDVLLQALFPQEKKTVKQYKDALIDTLKSSGEKTLDEMFDPGLFRLLERAAANGGALSETAAFFVGHRQETVNVTFLELLEALSPGGDPVRPETAVKVLIDTFYSKYVDSSKYTLQNLSADLGVQLYAYAQQFEALGTRTERASISLTLTLDDGGTPAAGEVALAFGMADFPVFDGQGGISARALSYEDRLSGTLTLA